MTAHKCVSSSGLVPMAISLERSNDSVSSCNQKMVNNLTRNEENDTSKGALSDIIPSSDREYKWN